MSQSYPPPMRHYRFDWEIGITAAVDLSGGDLAELIADGLTALDHEGMLFPGLTEPPPGRHLIEMKFAFVGYERRSDLAAIDMAYKRLAEGPKRKTTTKSLLLADDLLDHEVGLSAAILQLRILQARMRGLAQELQHGPAKPETRTAAEAALALAWRIIEQVSPSDQKPA